MLRPALLVALLLVPTMAPGGPAAVCPSGIYGPDALPTAPNACFPRFSGTRSPLPEAMRARMTGVSWRAGCPVALDDLVLVEVDHWGLDGSRRRGRLVVAVSVADGVLAVFERLYLARFPIERMEPVESFGGDDTLSMAANNTSAFNCRKIEGAQATSRHAHGDAVDLNPRMNPHVKGDVVRPPEGWTKRQVVRPGMVVAGGAAVRAFEASGWRWGGLWRASRDYQHFSRTGR